MPESKERSLPVAICADLTGYAGYYLANVLFLLLSLPWALVLAPFPDFKNRAFQCFAHHYARFLTRFYLPSLGICRVASISGVEHCRTNTPFVCVSNHRGRLDALLLIGTLKNTVVLIKAKHARYPMLAHLVRHCGFVSVDQSSSASIVAALQKCASLVAAGINLLVFPEGKRTTSARLQRFGSMAFKVAIDLGIPVVPVIVHAQRPFMARSLVTFFPRRIVDYRITFLEPAHPQANDAPADLADRVYRRMADELKRLDRGTEWEQVHA